MKLMPNRSPKGLVVYLKRVGVFFPKCFGMWTTGAWAPEGGITGRHTWVDFGPICSEMAKNIHFYL